VPHLRAPMSRSDGSKPPAVEQDAFALQSVAWEAAIGATGKNRSRGFQGSRVYENEMEIHCMKRLNRVTKRSNSAHAIRCEPRGRYQSYV
jgi:hypothetical protein